jgi:hypothetical protein
LAVGFCRAAWDLHTHFDIRYAVESAERFADGQLSPYEPLEARRQACREGAVRFHETWSRWAGQNPTEELRWWLLHELALAAADTASTPVPVVGVSQRVIAALDQTRTGDHSISEANRTVREIVRDVTGNPFRPLNADASWLTSDVVALARAIYEERAFDRMPILADALQDAGCEDEQVLNHCRSGGVHVRGCWVVDLVLGKG